MKISDFSVPEGTLVDIIVRARNGHAMTQQCLESIVANTPPFDLYRLILVDDGSDPPLDTKIVDFAVRTGLSSGAVTATNLGIALSLSRSDSTHTLILDNDVLVPEGDSTWLERMVAELEEAGEDCACVGATTGFANAPQHILASPQTYTHDWTDEKTGRSGVKHNPEVPWFVSFAVLFRKEALQEIGPWDEQYNPGNYEDTDYSVKLREAGWQIKVARSVYLHHLGHQTFKDEIRALMATNAQKFAQKWGIGRLFDLGMLTKEEMQAVLMRQS